MQDFLEILKSRRSVRRYEDKEVPQDFLEKILEAVRWSPSWTNTQCWEIIIIKDKLIKEQIQATLPSKNPAFKAILNAPIVLGICGKLNISGFYDNKASTKFGDWFMFDLGLAVQNMAITIHSLGLGTVIVGLFDHNKAKEILKVPETHELVAFLPIGFPAKSPSAPKRKEINEFVHNEIF